MNYDNHGIACSDSEELFWLLHKNPELDISKIHIKDPETFNQANAALYANLSQLIKYNELDLSLESFDLSQQQNWHMPETYKNLDIAKWCLDACNDQAELQRVAEELLLYQERDLFDLLRYLKYFVDVMRQHNVLWGIGRGSSVASFVLYLIGVHKINSLHYDLDIKEFLK